MSHGRASFDRKYYKRFFDKYSKEEFGKYVNWADGWVRFLDRYLDIKDGKGRTLHELGASLGYFSRIFKNRGFDVTASDISSYIVRKSGMIQKDIKFFKLNIENELRSSKKYDYIVAFEVLEPSSRILPLATAPLFLVSRLGEVLDARVNEAATRTADFGKVLGDLKVKS